MIISPRQARDKHRENSKKDAFLQAGVLTAFKLNETDGRFSRHGITNSLIEGNSYAAVKGAATRVQQVK